MNDCPLCDNDYVLRKENGKIYSINMQFDNVLRNNDVPAIISNKFKNMGIPAGLVLLNTINHASNTGNNQQMVCHTENNTTVCVNETLYDNLLKLYHSDDNLSHVEKTVKDKKNKHKKTRKKYSNGNSFRKTRRKAK
tara:strand:+ start:4922 stop:5332 length:411 start_codon:yes stop_codon:yes gene_type:complete